MRASRICLTEKNHFSNFDSNKGKEPHGNIPLKQGRSNLFYPVVELRATCFPPFSLEKVTFEHLGQARQEVDAQGTALEEGRHNMFSQELPQIRLRGKHKPQTIMSVSYT